MKRFVFTLIGGLIFISLPQADGAIVAKPLMQLAQVDSAATGILAVNDQIAVFGNREKNGFLQFIGGTTVELSCGAESFVSAGATDSDGNFYLVGAAANPIVGTLPPISGVLNPDNVIPDPVSSNKSDANTLCYWKIDRNGQVLDTQTYNLSSAVIPSALLINQGVVLVSGYLYSNPGVKSFILNWGSEPIFLGKSSTLIFGLIKSSDNSLVVVGQSGENLLDKKLRGKIDGILAKFTNGKLVLVQRSSDVNSNRAWRSSTNSLLLGGYSNQSAVITKFTSNFQPIWSDRYPSTGSALTAANSKGQFGAFVSNGAVKALPSWKRKNSILLLTFDKKGGISAANYIAGNRIDGLVASNNLGPLVLAGGFVYRT